MGNVALPDYGGVAKPGKPVLYAFTLGVRNEPVPVEPLSRVSTS